MLGQVSHWLSPHPSDSLPTQLMEMTHGVERVVTPSRLLPLRLNLNDSKAHLYLFNVHQSPCTTCLFKSQCQWTCRLRHGHKLALVGGVFRYHKHILTTNAAVRRQRNVSLVLWKKPKRSGRPRSVKSWTNWLQMKHLQTHQTRIQSPYQVQQTLYLLLWPKVSQ